MILIKTKDGRNIYTSKRMLNKLKKYIDIFGFTWEETKTKSTPINDIDKLLYAIVNTTFNRKPKKKIE
jgi:hypothetical protein